MRLRSALPQVFTTPTAGGKAVSPEPEEEMKDIDEGRATFTNKRVVFAGDKHTREWDFAKLLGWNEGAGGYISDGGFEPSESLRGLRVAPTTSWVRWLFNWRRLLPMMVLNLPRELPNWAATKPVNRAGGCRENFFGGPSGLTQIYRTDG